MSTETQPTAALFHYYDRHPTLEDLMGESVAQQRLLVYLYTVIGALVAQQPAFLAVNLNFYTRRELMQYPIATDLALILGVQLDEETEHGLRSWRLYEPGSPPSDIIIEVASDSTWEKDLNDKPAIYAEIGVREYVVYDPNVPQFLPGPRLHSWQHNGTTRIPSQQMRAGTSGARCLQAILYPIGASCD